MEMTDAFEKIQVAAEELRHLIAECEETVSTSFQRHMDEVNNNALTCENKKREALETAEQEKKGVAMLLKEDLDFLKEIDEKVQKVDEQFQEKYNAFAQKRLKGYERETLQKVRSNYEAEMERLKEKRQEAKACMEKKMAEETNAMKTEVERQIKDLETACAAKRSALDAQLKDSLAKCLEKMEEWVQSKNPQEMERTVKELRAREASSEEARFGEDIPDHVTLGQMVVDLEMREPVSVDDTIRQMAIDIRQEIAGKLETELYFLTSPFLKNRILFPYAVSLREGLVNHVITYDTTNAENRQAALNYLNAIEAMLYMRVECGMMKTTMIDPMDSAWNFASFASLGNVRPELISEEIATTEAEIVKHVNALEAEIKLVNTNYLSENNCKNIMEYNERQNRERRPLHFVFIADFPHGFQEETLQNLKRIVKNGPRCGIYTFLVAKASEVHGAGGVVEEILEYATEIAFPSPEYCVLKAEKEAFPMIPIRKPEETVWNAVKQAIGDRLEENKGSMGEASEVE